MYQIDLNADLGEGGAHDAELLTLVSSANISCGAHAGNPACIDAAIRNAHRLGVQLGAHPGYPDRTNFGRLPLAMSTPDLRRSLLQQLEQLAQMAEAAGASLRHVKPHGALYNEAGRDPQLARLLVAVLREFNPQLQLVALAGSALWRAGDEAGLHTLAEAFADRAYQADGSLVPRQSPGAVLQEHSAAIEQSLSMITEGYVYSIDGQRVTLRADTLCVHGDDPHALGLARALHTALLAANVRIARA